MFFEMMHHTSHRTTLIRIYAWKPIILGNVSREYMGSSCGQMPCSVRLKASLEDFVFSYFLTTELPFVGHPNFHCAVDS